MKSIIFSHQAAKDFDALPARARDAVQNGLIAYVLQGTGDVKKLAGRDGYRLRIGEYRVIFGEDRETILAVYIGRRSTTTYRRPS